MPPARENPTGFSYLVSVGFSYLICLVSDGSPIGSWEYSYLLIYSSGTVHINEL